MIYVCVCVCVCVCARACACTSKQKISLRHTQLKLESSNQLLHLVSQAVGACRQLTNINVSHVIYTNPSASSQFPMTVLQSSKFGNITSKYHLTDKGKRVSYQGKSQ